MGKEIEHKYLVKDDGYVGMSIVAHHIRQGYLSRVPERTVRVRTYDDKGFITVKGKNQGDTRLEFEYEVSLRDAEEMLSLCEPPVIDKVRYIVPYAGFTWEVDKFDSKTGLVTAEIELPESGIQYELPPFIGENVTGDPRYYNSNLSALL